MPLLEMNCENCRESFVYIDRGYARRFCDRKCYLEFKHNHHAGCSQKLAHQYNKHYESLFFQDATEEDFARFAHIMEI